MVIKFTSPQEHLQAIASRARAKRLAFNFTRRTLATRAGVSEASIKRFETTGEVSFHSLLKLAHALDCLQDFEHLFTEDAPLSIDDLQRLPKQRGSL